MSRIRSRAKAFAAVALAAALAVGCSSGGSSGPAAATGTQDSVDAALKAGGTITYWSWTPSAKDQVAAFEKEYPNVKVNYVNAGTNKDEYTKLQNAIKAGNGAPDVAQIEYYALPQFALTDSLVDLDQYGFGSFEKDYSASTWAQVKNSTGLYGLPQDSGPMALFYNKEVFDKNGIAVPKTWDEYVDAAKKLHAADPTKYLDLRHRRPRVRAEHDLAGGRAPVQRRRQEREDQLRGPGRQEVDRELGPADPGQAARPGQGVVRRLVPRPR